MQMRDGEASLTQDVPFHCHWKKCCLLGFTEKIKIFFCPLAVTAITQPSAALGKKERELLRVQAICL